MSKTNRQPKTAGPKEAELRKLREGKTDGGTVDATALLSQLEKEEADAYAEFQEAQRQKREKALAEVLEPLKERRAELSQQINDAHSAIAEIDRQLAKLTGRKEAPSHGIKHRKRIPEAEKLELARVIFGKLKASKGNRFRSADLDPFGGGIKTRDLVKIWNEKGAENNGEKIHVEGAKTLTRYFLPA